MGSTFYLLFSHTLTKEQISEVKNNLACDAIISLPQDLQELWSNIPSELDSLFFYLSPIKEYLCSNLNKKDYVLVQGDFGATYTMINYIKELGATPVYSTTKREVVEIHHGDSVAKQSFFKHIKLFVIFQFILLKFYFKRLFNFIRQC